MEHANPQIMSLERSSPAELADYIEQRYHAALRRDVPALIDAAMQVERDNAGIPGVPAGLGDLLAGFWTDMERHMAKEERVLFPLLRRGVSGSAVALPVRVMEDEHDAHRDTLSTIRELTGDFVAPPHADPIWCRLYEGLAILDSELRQHIELENQVLFARARISGARPT
jgi:regulator of cell morphogenesis and NO signaling